MTPHVLDQLPLWVEGDLNASEQAAIEAHLVQCAECRAASEQLRSSQAWLREGLASPFDAQDQERLRRRVMDRIQAEAKAAARAEARRPTPLPHLRPHLVPRPALLAASAAALLIAALSWRMARPLTPPLLPVQLPAPRAAETSAPALTAPPSIQAQSRPPGGLPARGAPASKAPESKAPESKAPDPSGEGPARIEFQTADPAIRIIWLAQASPAPRPIEPQPEEP